MTDISLDLISFRQESNNISLAVTMGNFDGFHLGHQMVVAELINHAKKKNLAPWLITFHPHPKIFFDKNLKNYLLTTKEEKISLLKETGLAGVAVIDFNQDLANLSPDDFLIALKKKLSIESILVGEDFHFGKNRKGDNEVLKKYIPEVVALQLKKNNQEIISSSTIRQYIADGEVAMAQKLLAHPYGIIAKIEKGDGIGQTINTPTINFAMADIMRDKKLLPAMGIYAGAVKINGKSFPASCYYGLRPSVRQSAPAPRLEAHILAPITDELYHQTAQIFFHHWLRADKKFANLEELEKQIALDNQAVLAKW